MEMVTASGKVATTFATESTEGPRRSCVSISRIAAAATSRYGAESFTL
jgi:hypothetical protein